MQPIEQPVQERGFSGSHLAGQQYKTLAILNAVGQPRQRFLNLLRQEEIARGRVHVERAFAKPKKFLVHFPQAPDPACTGESFDFFSNKGSIAGTIASTGSRNATSTSRSVLNEVS